MKPVRSLPQVIEMLQILDSIVFLQHPTPPVTALPLSLSLSLSLPSIFLPNMIQSTKISA